MVPNNGTQKKVLWIVDFKRNLIIALAYGCLIVGTVLFYEICGNDNTGQGLIAIPGSSIPITFFHCVAILLGYIFYFAKGYKESFKKCLLNILLVIGVNIGVLINGILLIVIILNILSK